MSASSILTKDYEKKPLRSLPENKPNTNPIKPNVETALRPTFLLVENATVGYQLLFGSEPYRVMDYNVVCDTPVPPNEVITSLPHEPTWRTVRKIGSKKMAQNA